MRVTKGLLFCALLAIQTNPAGSTDICPATEETISGARFPAIEAAMREFRRYGLKIDEYNIVVFEIGEVVHVGFMNPEQSLQSFGSTGRRKNFSVQLEKSNLRIIQSGFDR
jgi:hypothetical protein